jgi:hypothetical protein
MHGVQHTATSGEVRRRPDGAIACFNALKLFFCMSFGAIFGCGLIGVESDQYALVVAIIGAIGGLVIHLNTRRILA